MQGEHLLEGPGDIHDAKVQATKVLEKTGGHVCWEKTYVNIVFIREFMKILHTEGACAITTGTLVSDCSSSCLRFSTCSSGSNLDRLVESVLSNFGETVGINLRTFPQ
jgi:hypothetical protein